MTLVAIALVGSLGLARQQVTYTERPTCTIDDRGIPVCGGRGESADPGSSPAISSASDGNSSTSSDITYISYQSIDSDGAPDGGPCYYMSSYPLGPAPAEDPRQPFISPVPDPIDYGYPQCPARPAAQGEPETPSSFAAEYWRLVPLPDPDPYIAPGRAITGLFAYLETRNTTTLTVIEPSTPFGTLTVEATGSYYVDWGDGTRTGPHSREGGPWPDGAIKHEYLNVGTYGVVVTERWAASWTFGTESGTLEEIRTTGQIDDFPVQQIQAVILR